jgi:hypothetical protein
MTGRARAAISGVLGGAGAVAVAAALLTGSGATPAGEPAVSPAAATAGAPSAEPAAAPDHGSWTPADLAEKWAQLPEELQQDLAALRTTPAADRLAALHRIRDDALAGAYGEQVQAGAEHLAAGLAMLPPALVADLEGLVSLEVTAVPDAVERIRDRALSGQYGEQVRAGAERLVAMADQHGVDVRGDLDRYLPAGAAQQD